MTTAEKLKWVNTPPAWMYEFDLGDGVKTPLLADELRSIHRTRETMTMRAVDTFFPGGLSGKRCLDVACNEGYFSHLLYRRGATVKGIDVRESNIERARQVQSILDYDPGRLRFEVEDFFSNRDEPDTYDVSLFLGLLYHIENPMAAIRLLYKITRTLCVIETQLTRQAQPILTGWGQTDVMLQLPASLAIHLETDMTANNLAAYKSLSFVPNLAAVRLFLFAAGFTQVLQPAPPPDSNQQHLDGDRGVFLALK